VAGTDPNSASSFPGVKAFPLGPFPVRLGHSIDITLSGQAGQGGPLTYSVAQSDGGRAGDVSGNSVHYTARFRARPQSGTDSFTFTVTDSQGRSASASVSIAIPECDLAAEDFHTQVQPGQSVAIDPDVSGASGEYWLWVDPNAPRYGYFSNNTGRYSASSTPYVTDWFPVEISDEDDNRVTVNCSVNIMPDQRLAGVGLTLSAPGTWNRPARKGQTNSRSEKGTDK